MSMHFLLQIFCCLSIAAAADAVNPDPGCQNQCGNVSIPYPFGIDDPSCYRNQYFNLTCRKDSETDGLKPFWGELEVLHISTLGQMIVTNGIGWDCYSQNGTSSSRNPTWMNLYERGPFTFSDTRNKLIAVGCDNKAYINGSWGRVFTSGCMSYCKDEASVTNGSCNGIGCCQSSIPAGMKKFEVTLESFSNHREVWEFNPCSYSFLGDKDQFNFSVSDLHLYNFWDRSKTVPVVLDWMAANETCEIAKANKMDYACRSEKSYCNYSDNLGYGCNCLSGYQGNPYIQGGCQGMMIIYYPTFYFFLTA